MARLVVMLAALAGLFAMHGLSEHGVMQHDTSPMSSMTADVTADVLAVGVSVADSTGPVDDLGALGALADAVVVRGGSDLLAQHAGMAMMLCLAVLAGAVVLLLRARGLPMILILRSVTRSPRSVLGRTSREPEPPDLFVLSVQRC